jgi:hypothetical protein
MNLSVKNKSPVSAPRARTLIAGRRESSNYPNTAWGHYFHFFAQTIYNIENAIFVPSSVLAQNKNIPSLELLLDADCGFHRMHYLHLIFNSCFFF